MIWELAQLTRLRTGITLDVCQYWKLIQSVTLSIIELFASLMEVTAVAILPMIQVCSVTDYNMYLYQTS